MKSPCLRARDPDDPLLFMPASNVRALEKAKGLAADVIIMDLEDAVAPDRKDTARQQAITAVQGGGYGGREIVIRANGVGTPWNEADLKAVAGSAAAAVLLSKVESADDVHGAENLLASGGASADLSNCCMIESARGILMVTEIAAASPRIGALVMAPRI